MKTKYMSVRKFISLSFGEEGQRYDEMLQKMFCGFENCHSVYLPHFVFIYNCFSEFDPC